jgi:uncharacterized protein involved in exopolysaccharide biosynthesis
MEASHQNAEDHIDLRQLVGALSLGRWWIAGATLGGTLIASVVALMTEPVFQAQAVVQIRQDSKFGQGMSSVTSPFGALMDLGGLGLGGGGDKAVAVATLKSRVIIQGFIRDKDLLPELFDDKWDVNAKSWKSSDPDKAPSLWHGYNRFAKDVLKVGEDRKSGLYTISIEWRDPVAAATWVAELIARTNDHLRNQAVAEGERNLAYLQQQARQTGVVELQQAVYTLQESELKKMMLAKGGGEYAIKTIDPAQPPKQRVRPKRVQMITLGLLLGAFAGVVFVLARNALAPERA